jgi:S-DNA-T family DNA segregation ATPase FtsK/SpoIIIE
MRLKVSYQRTKNRPIVDLLINVDATATVGALADFLANSDPEREDVLSESFTLNVPGSGRDDIAPGVRLADSGILSGSTVGVSPIDANSQGESLPSAAVVIVIAGPDEGREFPLGSGSSFAGRDRSCEVRLSDPLVSRQHARIDVTETVEFVDLGSSNGLIMGDENSDRVVLRPGDTVKLGDTVLSVRLLAQAGHIAPASSVSFNRPPRIEAHYHGLELVAPEPPEPPRSQRFPILPLFAPLILGLVLYLSTHALTSLIFVGMSPLLIVANAAEARLSGRKAYRGALELFRQDIADLVEEAVAGQVSERERRLVEHPAASDAATAALTLGPVLWSRWPDLPGFCEVRIGVGRQPSRSRILIPTGRQNNRALWKELRDAVAPFDIVDGVPVVVNLKKDGALGIGGNRSEALGIARAYVTQAACLHSPSELTMVALASSQSGPAWEWVKWLPHCNSTQSPLVSDPLASTQAACNALVGELQQLVSERESRRLDDGEAGTLPSVLIVVEDDAPIVRSAVVDLARRAAEVGVFVLWLASTVDHLPAACRVFVEVNPSAGESEAGFVHEEARIVPLLLEPISEAAAEAAARKLSSVVDASAQDDAQGDLPRSVSFLALVGHELATSPEAVIERWNESRSIVTGPKAVLASDGWHRRPGTLRAIVGEHAAGPHVLDLRTHGPHALVGGTTGSGKSELLQSWILGMALSNSPQRITFLLVDYKGGSAFADCLHLPHTVGLVTDLSQHLVRRALTSLSAELKFREDLLQRKRAKDLLELERHGDPEAPPSLVIVVDEFAALVQEVPDFVDGVVNVAQRGRSLGLHLILATQRPAGVIKDNLRANTNLRLALRVADEADSTDVLGRPDAASFDPAIPGRALSRTGPSQLVPFQAAYAGGWTNQKASVATIEVSTLGFGPKIAWEKPDDGGADPDFGATDIQRVVSNVRAATALAEIPDPRVPWLSELTSVYDLARLPTKRRDDQLVFAVADDPERQSQPTVAFNPDVDGNLAVYGTGHSGKSTFLRTIAIAAGFTVRGGPCHVYGLDFGARGLSMLEALPHVGSVISGGDHERVGRLFGLLRSKIDERAIRYSKVGASTITSYRTIAEDPTEPRIILLVDGIGAFRTAYEGTEHGRLFDAFLGIAGDGRPVGIHVIISADRPGALPVALAASVQRRLALRMADPNDYSTIGLPLDVLNAESPPGRGLYGGQEIQVAVLGQSHDTAVQSQEVQKFAQAMVAAGANEAPPIESLTDRVLASELPAEIGGQPVLGLSGADLGPFTFEPRGTFTVSGPPGSGRTTALFSVISAVHRWRPDIGLIYFGNRRSPLAEGFGWTHKALSSIEAAELAARVPEIVGEASNSSADWLVVIEGLPDFLNSPADFALTDAVKHLAGSGHLLVTEGEPIALSGSYPLLVAARSSRAGIVLQPEQSDSVLFRAQFPRLRRTDFPPGRGLFVPRGGQPIVVQVAMP